MEHEDDPQLTEQVKKFHLDEKISHSCMIFDLILLITKLELSSDERRDITNLKKDYIVLVDLKIKENPEQRFAAMLEFLTHPAVDRQDQLRADEAIIKAMKKELNNIDLPVRINPPILMGADEIDDRYAKLMA